MLGTEKLESEIEDHQEESVVRGQVLAKNYVRIGVVERSPVTVDEFEDDSTSIIMWPEASVKGRNRKPVSDLVEYLLVEVLSVDNAHKSEMVGLCRLDGDHFPMTVFKVLAWASDDCRHEKLLDLIAAVPTMLNSAEFPDAQMSWLSPEVQDKALKKVNELLLTCGGRAVSAPIDITVNNLVSATLSGTYAPRPDVANLDPKAEEFIGRVVNTYSDPPGFEIRETDAKKKRMIRSSMAALNFEQLETCRRDKQILVVNVETTILPNGKPNHELVDIQMHIC